MDLSRLKIDRSARKGRRRRSGSRFLPWLILLLLVGAVWIFRGPIENWIDRFRLPTVQVTRVQRSHPAAVGAVRGAAANGYIVAARRAALSADTPGRIVELNVKEGSVVRKGDVVARLYYEEHEAALQRAEADLIASRVAVERAVLSVDAVDSILEGRSRTVDATRSDVDALVAARELAQIDVENARELVAGKVAPQRDLDAAESGFKEAAARVEAAGSRLQAAEAGVVDARNQRRVAEGDLRVAEAQIAVSEALRDQARATLEKTEVRAPFDGVVVLKDAEVGEVVSPDSGGGSNARGSVCTMVDFASLEVQADVPETSLAAVELGATTDIYLDAYPDRRYRGRVDRIWPTANRQKATVEVRVVFDEPDDRLRPEMGVRVVFLDETGETSEAGAVQPEQQPAILVPENAVVLIDGASGVFRLERDVARFQKIVPGERRSGRVSVEDGLSGGERIVLDPPPTLSDGDRVRIQEG